MAGRLVDYVVGMGNAVVVLVLATEKARKQAAAWQELETLNEILSVSAAKGGPDWPAAAPRELDAHVAVLVAGHDFVRDAGGVVSWNAANEAVDEAAVEAAVEAADSTAEGDAATSAQGVAQCSVVASAVGILDRADRAAPISEHPEQAAEDSATHSRESRAWMHQLASAEAQT